MTGNEVYNSLKINVPTALDAFTKLSTFRSLSQRSGATIKEDVACIDVLSGDHPEDVEVLGTVRQWQFYFHGVVIGIGEDAVLRKFVQAEGNKACFYCRGAAKFIHTYSIEDPFFSAACFPFIVSIINKSG